MKRYDCYGDRDDKRGDYVLHSDHIAAIAEKDREIEGLMRLIEELEKSSGFVCVGERYDHRTGKDVSIWEKRQ